MWVVLAATARSQEPRARGQGPGARSQIGPLPCARRFGVSEVECRSEEPGTSKRPGREARDRGDGDNNAEGSEASNLRPCEVKVTSTNIEKINSVRQNDSRIPFL